MPMRACASRRLEMACVCARAASHFERDSALESPAAVAVAAVIAVIAGGAALLLVMQGALVLELGLVELKARLAQPETALPAW